MSDLISRQAVLEYIASWLEMNSYYHPYSKGGSIPTSEIKDIVNSVPSAENKGEWIEESDNYGHSSYFCSRCGTQEGKPSDICPNCRARMSNSENPNKCFEGMTNGEVIQAMFPCTEVVEGDGITGVRIDTKDIGALMVLYTDWWNAPYQKGGEE